MKEVNMQEYYAFIHSYPGKLCSNAVAMTEPPLLQHHDFSLGAWPKSLVAQRTIEDSPTYRIQRAPEEPWQ